MRRACNARECQGWPAAACLAVCGAGPDRELAPAALLKGFITTAPAVLGRSRPAAAASAVCRGRSSARLAPRLHDGAVLPVGFHCATRMVVNATEDEDEDLNDAVADTWPYWQQHVGRPRRAAEVEVLAIVKEIIELLDVSRGYIQAVEAKAEAAKVAVSSPPLTPSASPAPSQGAWQTRVAALEADMRNVKTEMELVRFYHRVQKCQTSILEGSLAVKDVLERLSVGSSQRLIYVGRELGRPWAIPVLAAVEFTRQYLMMALSSHKTKGGYSSFERMEEELLQELGLSTTADRSGNHFEGELAVKQLASARWPRTYGEILLRRQVAPRGPLNKMVSAYINQQKALPIAQEAAPGDEARTPSFTLLYQQARAAQKLIDKNMAKLEEERLEKMQQVAGRQDKSALADLRAEVATYVKTQATARRDVVATWLQCALLAECRAAMLANPSDYYVGSLMRSRNLASYLANSLENDLLDREVEFADRGAMIQLSDQYDVVASTRLQPARNIAGHPPLTITTVAAAYEHPGLSSEQFAVVVKLALQLRAAHKKFKTFKKTDTAVLGDDLLAALSSDVSRSQAAVKKLSEHKTSVVFLQKEYVMACQANISFFTGLKRKLRDLMREIKAHPVVQAALAAESL